MYKLEFTKTATKKLKRLPKNLVERLQEKLIVLAANPHEKNNNAKKLVNRPGYRLRVGEWRIIYEINDDKLIILVLEIDTRGGIYQ